MMTIDEIIEVLEAYKSGKTIQSNTNAPNVWVDNNNPIWDFERIKYRVKKEPKFRPYKNQKEYLEAEKIHGMRIHYPLCNKTLAIPREVCDWGVIWTTFCDLRSNWEELSHCTWQDGTKCGIIE